MILARNWWKRRAAAAAPLMVVVDTPKLEFFPVDLEAELEGHGTYYVERAGSDWSVRFRPYERSPEDRDLRLDARDPHGEHIDWPTRASAEWACQLHAHLLELGYSALRAAVLVAERSQRPMPAQQKRDDTLDYAQPAGVRS